MVSEDMEESLRCGEPLPPHPNNRPTPVGADTDMVDVRFVDAGGYYL